MDEHSYAAPHHLRVGRGRMLLLFSVGYLLAVVIGERAYGSLAVPSPLWFPDSVLLCALLVTSRNAWPWLLAAAAGVRVLVGAVPGTPSWFILAATGVDLFKGVAAAWWLQRTLGRTIRLSTLNELVTFLGIAAVAVPMASALLVSPAQVARGQAFWPSAFSWFMGDAVAQVVVTPALLYWCVGGYRGLRSRAREAILVTVGLLALLYYLLAGRASEVSPHLVYAPMPFLIWAAVRLHPFGAANLIGLLAAAVMFRAVNDPSVFFDVAPVTRVVSLQLFQLVIAIPVLSLAVVTAERERDRHQLHVVLDAAPVSILMTTDPSGRRLTGNRAAYELHGLLAGENLAVEGHGAAQPFRLTRGGATIPPDQLPLRRSMALGRPVTGELITFERADGTRRYLHGNGAPLVDEYGVIRGAVGAFLDITDIRLAEKALRESEARFRLVADTAPVLIWMSEPDGRRTYFNRRWLDFRGRSVEEEAGHGWEAGLHPDDRQKYLQTCDQACRAGAGFDVEYRLLRADGRYRWVIDYGARRLDAAGDYAGYIGSCVDITERKATDGHLRELSGRLINAQERARARLARDLHDDIGQRITLMQISLSRFARSTEGLSLEAHRQLHTILQVVEKITVDIQGLSHRLHPSTLDALGLVLSLRSVCREFGEHSRLEVRFTSRDVPPDIAPETCLGLFRVAQEALTNVVKHSGVSEATLDLSCDGSHLTLAVSDAGDGFPLDRLEVMSQGLGLNSMRERLFLMGGDLHVTSAPGRGTSIRAVVPLRSAAKPAGAPVVAMV